MQKQIETTIRQDLENIWIYHSITKGNGFRILIFRGIEIFGGIEIYSNLIFMANGAFRGITIST